MASMRAGGGGARRLGLAGAAVLALATLGPVALGSAVSTFTQGTTRTADGKSLVLRVGVTGKAPEPLLVSVVYYRGAAGRCAATPQQQSGARIVDQVQVGPGPYSVSRTSEPLALGLWTVCGYTFRGTPPDNLFFVDGNGEIVGTDPRGSGSSGGKAPTAVALAAAPQGRRYVFGGRTTGARTGTVRIQRRAGSAWTTFATAAVRNGNWRVVAPARRGQTVRAVFIARGKQTSRSSPHTLR